MHGVEPPRDIPILAIRHIAPRLTPSRAFSLSPKRIPRERPPRRRTRAPRGFPAVDPRAASPAEISRPRSNARVPGARENPRDTPLMSTANEFTARLADLLRREHAALAEFLVALSEFDARRVWLELGHPNLFSFLHRELRLSKGAAHYRKVAAELVRKFPELVEPLRDGRLCITSVVELAKVLTPENRDEVLPRFFHRSKREAAEVVAALRPCEAPPRRTVVTPARTSPPAFPAGATVAAAQGAADAGPVPVPPLTPVLAENVSRSVQLAEHLDANSGAASPALSSQPHEGSALDELRFAAAEGPHVAASRVPAPSAGPPPQRAAPERPHVDPSRTPAQSASAARERDVALPLTSDLRRLHVTVSRSFLEKLEAARSALSHARPGATTEELLEAGLDLVLAAHAKRKGLVGRPRKAPEAAITAPSAADSSATPAHVPAHVRRAVWLRDGGRCQWRAPGGGVCGSTLRLELDHVLPRARGGPSTVENLRVLCFVHNQYAARLAFGDRWMDRCARGAAEGGGRAASSRGALPASG